MRTNRGGSAVSRKIESDDPMIFGQLAEDAGHLPIDVGARIEPVNQNHWLARSLHDVMDFDSMAVEEMRHRRGGFGKRRRNRQHCQRYES